MLISRRNQMLIRKGSIMTSDEKQAKQDDSAGMKMLKRIFIVADLIVQSDHYQKIKSDNQKKLAKTQKP